MKLLFLALISLLTFGCNPQTQTTADKHDINITIEDMTLMMNMHKWLIKAPESCAKGDRMGLKLTRGGEEEIIYYNGAGVYQENITKLMIWWSFELPREMHILWSDSKGYTKGNLEHKLLQNGTIGPQNEGYICTVGDTILSGVEGYTVEIVLLEK